jgi:hypothetical protein
MEEIIKNVKTSNMFTDIEHLIKEMIEIINKIRQNRETNSSGVKEQKRLIENEIQEQLLNAGDYCLQTGVYFGC